MSRPFSLRLQRLLARRGARLSELHPRIWQAAWWLGHQLRFLLPHDSSYYALRHFIAAAPKGFFLDVGANDGISALSFRRLDRNYRIFSLEPNVLLEPKLRQLKRADPNFDYKMVGAGSVSAQTVFYVPTYRGVLLHTFVSADPKQVRDGVQAAFGRSIADRTEIKPVEGQILRIDDLSLSPTIVKIDAEGFDYDALLGMRETIARSRPFIMVEVAWADKAKLVSFLEAKGYCIKTYDAASDRFSSEIAGEHRNYFAIPNERRLHNV